MSVASSATPKAHRPKTSKRGKYAKARVKAGQTYDSLQAMGFGMKTIQQADDGKLPKHPAIRASYLRAIGMEAANG